MQCDVVSYRVWRFKRVHDANRLFWDKCCRSSDWIFLTPLHCVVWLVCDWYVIGVIGVWLVWLVWLVCDWCVIGVWLRSVRVAKIEIMWRQNKDPVIVIIKWAWQIENYRTYAWFQLDITLQLVILQYLIASFVCFYKSIWICSHHSLKWTAATDCCTNIPVRTYSYVPHSECHFPSCSAQSFFRSVILCFPHSRTDAQVVEPIPKFR